MSTQELIETTRELFKEHKSTLTLRELVDIQQELFEINILALVGIRQNTGGLNLSAEEAAKIQDDFGNWIVETLSKKKE